MQITIKNKSKNIVIDKFIYTYIPKYIYDVFQQSVDLKVLKVFDEEFNIDSRLILLTALRNLLITKNGVDEFNIKINKTIRVGDKNIDYYITLITYGNREIKGYPIVKNIFQSVADNINTIYKEWEHGCQILWPSIGW